MNLGTNGTGSVVEHLTRSTAEMSPHERSAQADTMRRKLVELAAAHNRLVAVVDQQSAQVTALTARVKQDAAALKALAAVNGRLDFVSRSFMARVRWLVAGR